MHHFHLILLGLGEECIAHEGSDKIMHNCGRKTAKGKITSDGKVTVK
jgi:hypothetical protein